MDNSVTQAMEFLIKLQEARIQGVDKATKMYIWVGWVKNVGQVIKPNYTTKGDILKIWVIVNPLIESLQLRPKLIDLISNYI